MVERIIKDFSLSSIVIWFVQLCVISSCEYHLRRILLLIFRLAYQLQFILNIHISLHPTCDYKSHHCLWMFELTQTLIHEGVYRRLARQQQRRVDHFVSRWELIQRFCGHLVILWWSVYLDWMSLMRGFQFHMVRELIRLCWVLVCLQGFHLAWWRQYYIRICCIDYAWIQIDHSCCLYQWRIH